MIYILIYQRREGFIYCYCFFFVYLQDVHAANSLLLGPGSEWSTRHRPMSPLPHNIMRCDSCSLLQLFWCVCVCVFLLLACFFFLVLFFFFSLLIFPLETFWEWECAICLALFHSGCAAASHQVEEVKPQVVVGFSIISVVSLVSEFLSF